MIVTLEPYEVRMASLVGLERRLSSMEKDLKRKFIRSGTPYFENDIQSACAELAAAKGLDTYWAGSVNVGKEVFDLPLINTEVRSTKHKNGGLILRGNDKEDCRYVLVTGEIPTFELVGWLWGHEVKTYGKYIDEDNAPYWIHKQLNSINLFY